MDDKIVQVIELKNEIYAVYEDEENPQEKGVKVEAYKRIDFLGLTAEGGFIFLGLDPDECLSDPQNATNFIRMHKGPAPKGVAIWS